MSVKTVDFYDLGDFRYTSPLSLSFYGETYDNFDYWSELYVKFFELAQNFFSEKIENLARLDRRNGGSSVLFIEDEEIVSKENYKILGNSNVCLKFHFGADRLLAHMKDLVKQCYLDVSKIEIKYQASNVLELEDDYSDILALEPRNKTTFNERVYGSTSVCDSTPRSYPFQRDYVKFKGYPSKYVAERIIRVLNYNYSQGFRFDGTTLNLLESRAGYHMDSVEQKILRSKMYCRRDDGLCFLNESVASEDLCLRIAENVNVALLKFQCFELGTLYERFSGELNPVCIRNAEDFEDWFGDNFLGNIRTKNYDLNGKHRIVRIKSMKQEDATSALVRRISSELKKAFGTLEEETLLSIFDTFSIDFLNDLIRKEADDVIVSQINGRTCYQTFEALGIPDNFSEELTKTLEYVDELELEPTLDIINALLSLTFEYNFRNYFNIPNDKTYRRLIETYCQDKSRSWKGRLFREIDE